MVFDACHYCGLCGAVGTIAHFHIHKHIRFMDINRHLRIRIKQIRTKVAV